MAPANKHPNVTKRQTGTVPKTTAASSSSSGPTGRAAGGSTKTSSSSSRKNTEIVAPTRRELNDLNNYLLSVAESTKQQNNEESLDTACFELDNLHFQENQRSCWPVRPIPRKNILKTVGDNPVTFHVPVISGTNFSQNNNANSNTSTNLNSAAIGVVIPTTPNSTTTTTAIEDQSILNRLNFLGASSSNPPQLHQQTVNADEANSNPPNLNFDCDLTWEQRLNFIQYFLSLTSKSVNKDSNSEDSNCSDEILDIKHTEEHKMVNELNGDDVLMNSTSLEDVARSETSDARAQSVTSIHTASSPNTPIYEELQSKLEASNRNMQHIKDQQHQLIRLQQAAKQQLSEMETIRNQQNQQPTPHFNQNGAAPPDYGSVEEVHSDMSNLVKRMKVLTTFIQGQNELSSLLGDDGPEILAEQAVLQEKLQELKSKKQEMQSLVTELQDINTSAEASLNNHQLHLQPDDLPPRVVPVEYERVVPIELVGHSKQPNPHSTQNGHYAQFNGDQIHNGNALSPNETENSEDVLAADPQSPEEEEAADMIRQKMSDINAMKSQLKRLKDMMESVKLIEEKTEGRTAKQISDEASGVSKNQEVHAQRRQSLPKSINNRIAPNDVSFNEPEKDEATIAAEEEMSERVRLLHEMTQDLRDQAVHLTAERNRLKAIKDEMERRRDSDNIEDVVKKANRATSPTNSITNKPIKEPGKDILKAEYEAKKKEFEQLCERLENEEVNHDDEEEDDINESETQDREIKREQPIYYPETWRRPQAMSSNSSVQGVKIQTTPMASNRGKESADSGAVDVHGIASLEAGSFQSGSSRSFSMPPPMRTINTRDGWRKSSQDNSQSQFDHYAPAPPPLPVWNPNYYYSTPYSQQFSPHCHHHMMMPTSNVGSEYFCSHQFHPNVLNSSTSTATSQQVTAQNTGVTSSDPVLLQQFIQTQQMLINSVCQCNQLLWHQQREINNLNNAVLLLQERLLNQTGNSAPDISSIASANRAESVPPNAVANNLYTSTHRAQSEQPPPPPQCGQHPSQGITYQIMQTPMSPIRQFQSYNYSNVCQRRNVNNIQQCGNQHGALSSNSAYNFASSEQEAVFAANNLCGASLPPQQMPCNNSTPQQQQQQQQQQTQSTPSFLNNDSPHSANIPHPAPPIFMHHHNNTITPSSVNVGANLPPHHPPTNNSNILNSQQNCLNSPSTGIQQSSNSSNAAPVPNSSNAAAAAAALNNQVAPGNRANNYWDNFRSYSRQNLLSSNSCKSNEDQQQMQQQLSTSPFGVNTTANTVTTSNNHPNNYFNLSRNLQQLNGGTAGGGGSSCNSSSNSNNLTPPTFDNKFFHTFRNQFNNNAATTGTAAVGVGQPEQQQQQQPQASVDGTAEPNLINTSTSEVESENTERIQIREESQHQQSASNIMAYQPIQSENLNINQEIYNLNNNVSSNSNNSNTGCHNNNNNNVAAVFGSPDFRNMNFNFEVNELRKKTPFKTSCSAKHLRYVQPMFNEANNPNQLSSTSNTGPISTSNSAHNGNSNPVTHQPSAAIGHDHPDDNSFAAQNGICSSNDVSDEIKKNLLVNALKNEKFTSKFFESLKEDVYREVYTIIQATESHPHYLVQLFKELQLVSINDPLRNIVMQAMHDLYKRSCNNETEMYGTENENAHISGHIAGADSSHAAPPVSAVQSMQNIDNSNESNANNITYENNHDNEIMNILLNSQELRRLAYKIMFESSSPTRIEKGKKTGVKYDLSSPEDTPPKPLTEYFRPDFELVNHIMSIIQNTIHCQKVDDPTMIRIAKLTLLSLENASSSIGRGLLQIDRQLISPKELYRVMKTFEATDRESFFGSYEAYLQSLFVMKIINEDANNVNLAFNKPRDTNRIGSRAASAGALLLTNDDVQNLRKHAQACKSNIPIISTSELGIRLNAAKNHDHNEEMRISSSFTAHAPTSTPSMSDQHRQQQQQLHQQQQQKPQQQQLPQQSHRSNNPQNSHPPDLITQADVALVFGNIGGGAASGSNGDQASSPCTNNNIVNEDLAEADQICTSSSAVSSSTFSHSLPATSSIDRIISQNHQQHQQLPASSIEDYINEQQMENGNEPNNAQHMNQVHHSNRMSRETASSTTYRDYDTDCFVFEKAPSFYGKFITSSVQQQHVQDSSDDISNREAFNSSTDENHSDSNTGASTGAGSSITMPIMCNAACSLVYSNGHLDSVNNGLDDSSFSSTGATAGSNSEHQQNVDATTTSSNTTLSKLRNNIP